MFESGRCALFITENGPIKHVDSALSSARLCIKVILGKLVILESQGAAKSSHPRRTM
jgi:hypothetical protein